MKAVILAGGLGTRLAEETSLRPKPMVEIGDRPILWHIMKIYAAHGINDFVICLGYKGYMIKEYFANYFLHSSDLRVDMANNSIEYLNSQSEPWNVTLVDTGAESQTGGRLGRVARYLDKDEPFLFTYGDGVGDIDVSASIEFHKREGRKCTMTAVSPPGRFGALKLEGNQITDFMEKPQGDNAVINGGYFVCDPSVIDLIDADDCIWERKPLETLAREGELSAFTHKGFWQPMDTLREKRYLQSLWDSGEAPWKIWKD
ncbi:glucose-1-phosphate cytidylyltransferase [Aestuariispira insulae]|uniref:Glucose-1-phosphate cytidylyltransferase n=1 Tax=Aestuariispira insulae TaxID=1461337 RepID=A0A3D9HMX6_9PROT|nr:glucose-1-phosphate cytidylyltransferase [Aestuariispira insulae]RED50819.1 glucose-1-phosphate cytidylyltransferase [Aestuariispira insulae]